MFLYSEVDCSKCTVNKKDLRPVRAKSNLYSLGCQGGIAPKVLNTNNHDTILQYHFDIIVLLVRESPNRIQGLKVYSCASFAKLQ